MITIACQINFLVLSFGSLSSNSTSLDFLYLNICAHTAIFISNVLEAAFRGRFLLEKSIQHQRAVRLAQLPVHSAIINRSGRENIFKMIQENKSTIHIKDFDGYMAFDLAMKQKSQIDVIYELLSLSLPGTNSEFQEKHGYAWTKVVRHDYYSDAVQHIVNVNTGIINELANTLDQLGRKAVNIASKANMEIILKCTYFFRRFEKTSRFPPYQSTTCKIFMAIDHDHMKDESRNASSNEYVHVCMKFMSDKDQFWREINNRKNSDLDPAFVVPIIASFYGPEVTEELTLKDLGNFPYVIVMLEGERSLQDILTNEVIASDKVRFMANEIVSALEHLHSNHIMQYVFM